MKMKPLLLVATALSLAGMPAMADSYMFFNYTDAAKVFNRPTDAGDQLSEIGTAVPYFSQVFTVGATGNYNLSVTAQNPASFDTFIHLYSAPFNASSPLDNFIAANDDAVSGNPDLGSALNGITLQANQTYAFVIDGFGNSDFGNFMANISGPGGVSPVPEPATTALAGLGVAMLFIFRRRAGAMRKA